MTEEGYVSTDTTSGGLEPIPDLVEDEDEDDEVVVDGEVDEGDVHIKPTSRKPVLTVMLNSSTLVIFGCLDSIWLFLLVFFYSKSNVDIIYDYKQTIIAPIIFLI